MLKAIETSGFVNAQHQLLLNERLLISRSQTLFGNAFFDALRRTISFWCPNLVLTAFCNAERCVKAFPNGVWERE